MQEVLDEFNISDVELEPVSVADFRAQGHTYEIDVVDGPHDNEALVCLFPHNVEVRARDGTVLTKEAPPSRDRSLSST